MTLRGAPNTEVPRRKPLIIGSFNKAKAAEMAELLNGLTIPVLALHDFPYVRSVEETGTTFAENACAKALGFARQLPPAEFFGVVADDSGLEVDALENRPGVFSARYVSKSATDPERVARILEELGDLPAHERTARFRCHVAVADADKVFIETDGVVEGRISFRASGNVGFGYDPIFIPDGHNRTFGELGYEVKHKISHRAKALQALRAGLQEILEHCRQRRH